MVLSASIVIYSCKKSREEEKIEKESLNPNLKAKIAEKYQLKNFDVQINENERLSLIEALEKQSVYYKEFQSELLLNNIRKTTFNAENATVFTIPFKGKDKALVLKFSIIGSNYVEDNEFVVERKLESKEVGFFKIQTRENEVFQAHFDNGIKKVEEVVKTSDNRQVQFDDCYGNHGGTGFCQREPGESISACYKAEVDEFCSDLLSCAGLIHWGVHAVILASCSCAAKMC
ncbi:hypothetical protein [Pedobacter sp. SL55]|uniref:hypothetical protein n=1 Tax=Pedobacter sp. SL55 TaxID=2995161 RepID=UPI00226E1967|nr:hypothetical protein [Pedobacter sp. SL55]WAC42049.1 hypothetical protein OVA16_06735 [Pedobacter sp. SL55]